MPFVWPGQVAKKSAAAAGKAEQEKATVNKHKSTSSTSTNGSGSTTSSSSSSSSPASSSSNTSYEGEEQLSKSGPLPATPNTRAGDNGDGAGMPLEGGVNGGHRQHFEAAHVHPDHRQSVFADLSVTAHHSTPKAYSGPSSTLDRPAETPLAESSSQTSSTSAARHHHHQQQQQQRRSDLPPLPPDSSHASPLSSYNRPPMPGSPPGAPLSLSPPMTHVATLDNGPISIDLNSPASSDAAVSAQILNLANMIVSPVPQSGLDRETASSMLGEQHSRPQRQQQQRHRGDIDRADGGLIGTYGPSTSNGAVPRPQSSFSIIDDPQSASRRRTSSSHRRQASDESDPNSNSPPKPKLRNLDTSMLAARSKVSSFFGGLSDSLGSAGGHTQSQQQQPQQQQHQQQQRQNSTNAQQYATPSTSSHNNHAPQISYDHAPQSIPSRQASPQPRPSSSYPSTSHMQPPPSSAAQTRSLSQPLQHQQQIPEYAIPQQHGQQPSISSTATGSSTNLHPRSSFYGLDAHTQQQSVAGEDTQQAQRWRGERRASPSTIGSNSRPASRSVPRSSDTGHYPSPSLGAASSIGGGYTGSNEGAPRRRVASWATRSNTSSVYGLSMTAPHLAPSPSADLPSAPSVAHLSQAHLRPGHGVSLLSHQKTLDMYRANVKKTNDPEVTFELAQFMLGLAREMAIQELSSNSGGHPMAPGMTGMSDENLLASLNGHHHQDGDSSPSPDPSFSFHSRSSGSSGDLASAATGLAANGRAVSSQGIPSHPSNPINAAGLQKRRGSHSPSPSMSTTRLGMNRTGSPVSAAGASVNDRKALVAEAVSLLKRSADRGHVASQFFLADIYANGGMESQKSNRASIYALLPGNSSHGNAQGGGSGSGNVSPMETKMNPSPTGSAASLTAPPFFNPTSSSLNPSSSQQQHQKPDFDKALPLFIAAAKHGHAPSCFRAGECFENGWGCRKDSNKAVQFYRKSAASSFPEAMYRLGMAELNGELGLKDRQKEGFKWLKQVAALAESNNENANTSNSGAQDAISAFSSSPSGGFGLSMDEHDGNGSNSNQGTRLCTVQALHELALLHERGIDNVVFVDNEYAAELLARASELGYAPSAYKLGECYEYGRMGCPQDAALSIHYYNIAAQQNHREACFALTAWYLVGSPGVLPQSDTEAYLWAKKAAEQGLAKAEYAVGYFTEVGIGCIKDERDAIHWFRKAAEHGDKRAITRLRTLGVNTDNLPQPPTSPRTAKSSNGRKNNRISSANTNPSPGNMAPGTPDQARPSDGMNPGKENKRRSRRSTLPGLMGMSNKEERPPLPNGTQHQQSTNGKKTDGDCVIS